MGIRTSTLLVVVLLCAACTQPESPAAGSDTQGGERTSAEAGETTVSVERDPQLTPEPAVAAPPAADLELVFINGVQLASPDLAELTATVGAAPVSGRYWYDATSGLWGLEGHGAGGVTRTGLHTAAPLAAEASAGKSGAFVNGRQLPVTELTAMATLLSWPLPADSRYSGHYTLDGEGALNSFKGRYLGNLAAAAKRAAGTEPPSAKLCIWFHLHEPDAPFGRDVTIACD
jgi:hypothetical protein